MHKIHRIMKADAESIVGSSLADELEDDRRKRLREKGELEDGMVLKSGEEKGIEMEIEVGFRPYGGCTSLKDALDYVAALESARDVEREINESISIFDGVVENVLSDPEVADKRMALRGILSELKNMLQEKKSMVSKSYPSIRGAISLKGAMRNLASSVGNQGAQISLGTVLRLVSREIQNLPAGNRERALAQLKSEIAAFPGASRAEKGTIRWIAELNSGLNPQTGRPIEEHAPSMEEIVEEGMTSIKKAIERSAARQQRKASHTPEMSSIRRAALKNSGIDPDTGEILF